MTVTDQYDTKEEDCLYDMRSQIKYLESCKEPDSVFMPHELTKMCLENLKEIDSDYAVFWDDILIWVEALKRNGQHSIDIHNNIVYFGRMRFSVGTVSVVTGNISDDEEEVVADNLSNSSIYEIIRGLLG